MIWVKASWTIASAVEKYLHENDVVENNRIIDYLNNKSEVIRVDLVKVNNSESNIINLDTNRVLEIEIEGELFDSRVIEIECLISDRNGVLLAKYAPALRSDDYSRRPVGPFHLKGEVHIPENVTNGEYNVGIDIAHPRVQYYARFSDGILLTLSGCVSKFGTEHNYSENGFLLLE